MELIEFCLPIGFVLFLALHFPLKYELMLWAFFISAYHPLPKPFRDLWWGFKAVCSIYLLGVWFNCRYSNIARSLPSVPPAVHQP